MSALNGDIATLTIPEIRRGLKQKQFTAAELESWIPGYRIVQQWNWSMAVVCKVEKTGSAAK